jgi:predicted lipoprotein with Yx(FWY)xxD motif
MKSKYSMSMAAIAVVVVLVFAGLASAGAGDKPQIKQKEVIGNYLADGKGMTLYYFKKDQKDKNACTGPCLEKWPIYNGGQVQPPRGSDAKEFGEFTRADGKKQSTFKGWPLYYFAGDKAPGDTNGQGVKDVWYVVNPTTIASCD